MDKSDGLNYPNMQPEEIDVFLNLAQDRWTKQRYGENNPGRISFEESQKRSEDLKELIKTKYVNTFSINGTYENINKNSVIIPLESDHWFIVQEYAVMTYPGCNKTINIPSFPYDLAGGRTTTVSGVEVEVIPISHLEYGKLNTGNKDPFNQPDNTKILRLMYNNNVELIFPEGSSMIAYKMRYIKKPTRVSLSGNVTFEMSDHCHDEIVTEAVKIALEDIEAKRIQTFPIIDNNKE
jgi:hypothetical protein